MNMLRKRAKSLVGHILKGGIPLVANYGEENRRENTKRKNKSEHVEWYKREKVVTKDIYENRIPGSSEVEML